ncbi:MAG: hypothetical protein JST00_42540 [Deltaproteobacteria bacterium]|nr:hypothetical protein [Deltaproteobacteria bacterium]
MDNDSEHVELWFDSILLGRVSSVIAQDGVVFGVFASAITNPAEPLALELLRYVEFCIDWNQQAREERDPPSASQFDAFASLVKSRRWFAKRGDLREDIEGAPVFFEGNEVSWRVSSG